MERDGDDFISGDKSHPHAQFNGEETPLSSTLYLDQVGEVVLTCNSDGLSWKCVELLNKVSFLLLFFYHLYAFVFLSPLWLLSYGRFVLIRYWLKMFLYFFIWWYYFLLRQLWNCFFGKWQLWNCCLDCSMFSALYVIEHLNF